MATRWFISLFAMMMATTALFSCGDDEGTKKCNDYCNDDEECVDGYSCVYGLVNNTKANTVCLPDPCKTCGSGCNFRQDAPDECSFVSCK